VILKKIGIKVKFASKNRVHGWGRRFTDDKPIFVEEISGLKQEFLTLNQISIVGGATSYGDSILSNSRKYFSTKLHNSIAIDVENAVAICGGGLTFRELLAASLPFGLIPCVIPGTYSATVGGAVAVDAHGKSLLAPNCMSNSILQFKLVNVMGEQIVKPEDELFKLTCGGLGSTGFIDEIHFKLRKSTEYLCEERIRVDGFAKLIDLMFENQTTKEFQVALLRFGKARDIESLLITSVSSNENRKEGRDFLTWTRYLSLFLFPLKYLPFTVLNRKIIDIAVNLQFASREFSPQIRPLVNCINPLERIKSWHFLHGREGLTQWQRTIPFQYTYELEMILQEILSSRFAPTLITLKTLHETSKGNLGFVQPGWNLAIDFNYEGEVFLDFLKKLDSQIQAMHGKPYLAKDDYLSSDECKRFFSKRYFDQEQNMNRYVRNASKQLERLFML